MALGTPVAAAAAYSASGGTSVAPAYPTGITADDVLVLIVGQKPSTANGGTVTTPTGWTLRDELLAAGGYGTTLGADTGNTNLRVYTKNTVAGTETGTLAVTLGVNNIAWAFIVRIPDESGTLSFGFADGQRTTTPTSPLSIALTNGATATNFATGDIALWAMCTPTDIAGGSQFSAPTITATGATFSTGAELNEPFNQLGNDIGGYSAWARVTAGSSTTAPTVTTTLSGTIANVRGPVVLLRIRETFPTRTGTFAATESGSDGFDTQGVAPKLGPFSYSAANPTSITVQYPTGITSADAVVLVVAFKDPTSTTNSGPSAPAGWTGAHAVPPFVFQGVISDPFAENTGSVGLYTFTKDSVTGTESGSVAINFQGIPSVVSAVIIRYPGKPNTSARYKRANPVSILTPGASTTTRTGTLELDSSLESIEYEWDFLYFGVSSTTEFGLNTFSGHSLAGLGDITPVKQIAEYGTNNGLNVGGFVAWAKSITATGYQFSYSLNAPTTLAGLNAGFWIYFNPIAVGDLSATEGADTFEATKPRPDLGTRSGSLSASESAADSIGNGSGESISGYLLRPPVVGTVAYGTTAVAPSYPAGIAANAVIAMFVAQKPSTAGGGTITTPTGWTLQGFQLNEGGFDTTTGIDQGNQNIWVFTKTTVSGTETGTVSVTLSGSSAAWAAIVSLPRSNAHSLNFLAFAGNGYTDGGTGYASQTFEYVVNPGDRYNVLKSDFVIWAASRASDTNGLANFSNLRLGSDYVSTGPTAELVEASSATGNDIGGVVAWMQVADDERAIGNDYAGANTGIFANATVVDGPGSWGAAAAIRIRVVYPAVTGSLVSTESADTFAGTGTAAGAATNLTASRYDNSQAFFAPTVTLGAVTLTPARYDNTQTFYAAAATPGASSLTAARYDNAQIFYAPALTQGAVTLTPGRYDNTQIIYAASVTVGAANLTAARYDNAQTFYAPTVSRGAVTLSPARYDNAQTFYAPTVNQAAPGQTLQPDLVTNTSIFYSPSVEFDTYVITKAQARNLYRVWLLQGLAPQALTVAPSLRSAGSLSQSITQVLDTVTVSTTSSPTAVGADPGTMIDEIALLHGLGSDLVVTPLARSAGAISQTLTTTGSTTTVTRV